ncbi:MAG: efflux RND transporter periplasmic adaptor subunit [Deltaproteobacteria bacterium]|nr:efflux RND transporter periplasmic adaptor subunit [Deltaproteobacteria bacterium]
MRPPSGTAALLAAVAVGFVACSSEAPEEIGATAKVERSRIERRIVATGTIEPEKEVEVRPRISGIVEAVHVEAGDRVAAGEPLIEVERELTQYRLREAQAQLDEARAELRFAGAARQRADKLHRGGTMDEQAYDEVAARFERAQAAAARAEASERLLQVELRYATVEAPIDGKILDVDVEEGSAVASVASVTGGTPLLSIAADEVLHLEGLVDENEIARVAIGQEARLRTEAFGDRVFRGRVRDVAPIGERQQSVTYFEVEVAIEDEDAKLLRPRMSGDADIIAEVVEDALVIPETALVYDGEDVFVEHVVSRDPPETERVPIEIGIVDDDRVEVKKGLEEGWEVELR